VEPTLESSGLVGIETPGGDTIYSGQENASARISGILGRPVRLENSVRPDEKTSIDRDTVFGDVSGSGLALDRMAHRLPMLPRTRL
jgi:hypothetical protein